MLASRCQELTESFFASMLKQALDESGIAPHGLAMKAGISPSNLYGMLAGRRRPSDNDLKKIGEVEELGTDTATLKWWADMDRLGPSAVLNQFLQERKLRFEEQIQLAEQGMAHLVKVADEAPRSGLPAEVFDPIRKAIAEFRAIINIKRRQIRFIEERISESPDVRPERFESRLAASDTIAQVLEALPEDMEYPPTAREIRLLARIGAFDGGELDPRSGSPIWQVSPDERWPELRLAEQEWKEANQGAESAGRDQQ